MTASYIATHPGKKATLFAPNVPFTRKLIERISSHGFQVAFIHCDDPELRLELYGPPRCGKSTAIKALADKSTFPAIDILTLEYKCHPERGNFEAIDFRPHRHPHTDN